MYIHTSIVLCTYIWQQTLNISGVKTPYLVARSVGRKCPVCGVLASLGSTSPKINNLTMWFQNGKQKDTHTSRAANTDSVVSGMQSSSLMIHTLCTDTLFKVLSSWSYSFVIPVRLFYYFKGVSNHIMFYVCCV